jgi:Family of unknown function (DUF5678)
MTVHVLPLDEYPGEWIAIDRDSDQVLAHAATPEELVRLIRDRRLDNAVMMRSPDKGEPLYVGLG